VFRVIIPLTFIICFTIRLNNGVDCEFSDNGEEWFIYKLEGNIGDTRPFIDCLQRDWRHCRPRYDEWLAHMGDKCPVPEGFIGWVRLAIGVETYCHNMTNTDWGNNLLTPDYRIVAFMITGIVEGYQLKGE